MQRRDFLRRAALGLFVPLGPWAQEAREPTGEISIEGLERLITKLLLEARVPALSIALVRDGKLLWSRGFGVGDAGSKEPVNDETIFEAASVSKTVFAYAVMKLCEDGVMDLDTPLTKYSPKPFLEGDRRLELITARQVLSHTSGFQDWRSGEKPLKVHFTPGTSFAYSGEGYYYLQSVVTHLKGKVDTSDCAQYEGGLEVCGTDIDLYMKKNLLTPFRMTHSGYVWNELLAEHAARPHDIQGKASEKKKPRAPDTARYGSAGGLHTTARDYAKFLIEIVAPRKADTFRLNQKSLGEMVRPQVKLPEGEKIDGADSWALGWAVQERKTGNVLVHSGGQDGFRSLTMASVEKKSGFIMLTNGDNGGKVLYNQGLGEILNRLLLFVLLAVLLQFGRAFGAEADLFKAEPLTPEGGFTEGIEGPACDRAGNIYAVNFAKQQTIGRTTPDGKSEIFLTLPGASVGNGIVFDREGTMFVADYVGHNVLRIDLTTRRIEVLAHDERMNQPNDLAIGPDGTLFASDPAWKLGTGQLWRIDKDGKTARLAADLGTSNGIEVSPDGKTLYVNESVQRNVWAWTITAEKTLSNKRLVRQFPDFGFDGMRCDVEGNLYITRHGKGTVVKMTPSGEILREIDVLGKKPSNLCFGGPDGKTVYVTEVEHARLVRFRVDQPGLAWSRWGK